MKEELNLDHPCRDTCSGWRQGYERGYAAACEAKRAEVDHWSQKYGRYVDKWNDANATLEAERARVANIIKHAWRLLTFGLNQTECDGVLSIPAKDLWQAIEEYEAARD